MQGKQIIIPQHPQQHRIRTLAVVGVVSLAVILVGTVQVMMTFSKQQLAKTHDDFTAVADSIETAQEEALDATEGQGENITGFVDELRRVMAEKKAEDEAAVPAEGTPPDAPDSSAVPAEGTVAGAQTETPVVTE